MTHTLGYLCSSTSWGGLEMNQLKNANWMKERGHAVYLLCKANSPIEKAAKELNIPILLIESHRKYYDFKAGRELSKIIDNAKITHLIVRDTRDMSVAVIAKRKAVTKIHLSYFMEMQLGVKKKNLLHSIRFAYFDLWSCPLNWLEKQVLTMTRMNPKKVMVIPSGLDLRMFEPTQEQQEARMKLDLPQDKTIFGLIGRFDPHKGQVLLLEALTKIDDPNVCVCFLGEPTKEAGSEYVDLMNKTVQDNDLSSRVFIRPFRKDIAIFFYAIDAFVMASKAETFGMVTIESMACGTPVIASNAGGSPEILDYGKFGLLFEPLNAESLATKMMKFTADQSMFSATALKENVVKYDHEKVCGLVEEALMI
jgi:glycosyltransferase involved in cell wall biosynthesis